ncbi:transmembrane and coiled-coil domains protein 1-like [Narcine bancroftii]|uniref:transmembrane and coiled-coil domains protein 1-like n=1 Tax=Narcine bancroftii TaxID=1343680 RepID=UPI0038317D09
MRGAKKQKTPPPEQVDPGVPVLHINSSPEATKQDVDGEGAQPADVRAERSALQQEALRLTEKARHTQAARLANMSEYLRLSSLADSEQAWRLEQAFQAKDGRLSTHLANQRARLGRHLRRLDDLDQIFDPMGLPKSQNPETGLPSAPDPEMGLPSAPDPEMGLPKAQALEPNPGNHLSQLTNGSEDTLIQDGGQEADLLSLLEELAEAKEALLNLEFRLKLVTEECRRDHTAFEGLKHENAYRLSQMQAQLNDLMDLHDSEVSNLQRELASLEEKIAYQLYESGRDIWEELESFQTKLTRLEHQQQQASQVEGLDSLSPRELLGKSMNLLLIAFAVVLMLMSTLSALVLPFISTRARTVTTCAALLLLVCFWRNWDSFNPWPAGKDADHRP